MRKIGVMQKDLELMVLDYPDNMVTYFYGEWNFGDAGYGGDYMMAAQVMSYGGGDVYVLNR